EAAPPWRVKDFPISIPPAHHILPQQQIQMMMAVLVDQVVNQIEAVTVETVDERQAGAVAVAEAHHPLCLERDDSGRQEAQQLRTIRPGLPDHGQRALN